MSKYQPEDDDVDEFLYGSGKEELATNNDRTVGTDQSGSDAKDAKCKLNRTSFLSPVPRWRSIKPKANKKTTRNYTSYIKAAQPTSKCVSSCTAYV